MARKKISEAKAKQLIFPLLDLAYESLSISTDFEAKKLSAHKNYVIKVDQAVKGRMKKGLLAVNITSSKIDKYISQWSKLGYSNFIVEPYIRHQAKDEHYISIERVREGYKILFSRSGGINIDNEINEINVLILKPNYEKDDLLPINQKIGLKSEFVVKLISAFDKYYISFLEINPLVFVRDRIYLLDLAVEVDDAGEFFVQEAWSESDFMDSNLRRTPEELQVKELARNSPAAFSLTVLNKDGAVGMLLSSGGASIVTADEVGNLGFGQQLLNYGEYSGGPTSDETYVYAKNILSLLLKSAAKKKVLVVAGGVANFTDIRITFCGIIQAMREEVDQLRRQRIKVFVRRGGPNQQEGLQMMKDFLQREKILGQVAGPEILLTDIVKQALTTINAE